MGLGNIASEAQSVSFGSRRELVENEAGERESEVEDGVKITSEILVTLIATKLNGHEQQWPFTAGCESVNVGDHPPTKPSLQFPAKSISPNFCNLPTRKLRFSTNRNKKIIHQKK